MWMLADHLHIIRATYKFREDLKEKVWTFPIISFVNENVGVAYEYVAAFTTVTSLTFI